MIELKKDIVLWIFFSIPNKMYSWKHTPSLTRYRLCAVTLHFDEGIFFPRFYYYILLSDFSKRQHYLEYDISNYQSTNWLSMPLSHTIMISYNKSWWYGAKMQKRGRFLMLEEKKYIFVLFFCIRIWRLCFCPPKIFLRCSYAL